MSQPRVTKNSGNEIQCDSAAAQTLRLTRMALLLCLCACVRSLNWRDHGVISSTWLPLTAYILEVRVPGLAGDEFTPIYRGPNAEIHLRGVLPGIKYSFRVRGVNEAGKGSAGPELTGLRSKCNSLLIAWMRDCCAVSPPCTVPASVADHPPLSMLTEKDSKHTNQPGWALPIATDCLTSLLVRRRVLSAQSEAIARGCEARSQENATAFEEAAESCAAAAIRAGAP